MAKSNKLTIYLLKDGLTTEDFVKDEFKSNFRLVDAGLFYFDCFPAKSPSWVTSFFKTRLSDVKTLFIASSKGVLVMPVDIGGVKKWFAVCFGNGRHMLNNEVYEERFGLRLTLNSIDPNSIRAIEKVNIGAHSKNSKEQLSKASKASDFGIDIEQDLLRTVTGKSIVPDFGRTITGVDSFNASAEVNIDNLASFLTLCHKQYTSDTYLAHFDWIDQIKELKSKELIKSLDSKLLEALNNRDYNNVWMAIPEVINWDDIAGFKYLPRQRKLKDDLNIADFAESIDEEWKEIAKLKRKIVRVFSASSENEIFNWSAYKCFYAEFNIANKFFILNSGKWFEVENNFVKAVNESYSLMPLSDIVLPDYNHDNEGHYNEDVASKNVDFFLMDKKTISHGGGSNRIEFCDIFTRDNQLVHVKQYGASSVLSHLFMQGLNSAEYFVSDSDFRRKLNDKLPTGWKLSNPASRINPQNYEVVYAIISNNVEERPRIPFFSKVSIKNAKRRLETMHYKMSLKRIKSIK